MNKFKIQAVAKKLLKLMEKNKYVLIVLAVGLIILIIPSGGSSGSASPEDDTDVEEYSAANAEFSIEAQEAKIAQALSEIQGAGNVTVVLSPKTTMEQEVAVDEDGSGGEETVTVSTGSGTESPVTIKYYYPEYKGALIVAEGIEDASVKLQITEAVSALTGLGSDRISVINKEI